MDREEMTMEQAFDALQQLLSRMEGSELPLEENFRLYEQGLGIVKYCHDKLDTLEKQLIVLEGEEELQ